MNAFIRAIIEPPEDDAPRLVYADWLAEHGEPSKAAFILGQIREGLQQVPLESGPNGVRWLWADLGEKVVGQLTEWRWRRGFVEFVGLTCESLLGGECGRCEGNRVVGRPRPPGFVAGGQMTMMDDCPACSGTGRTPGIAKELFSTMPVTSVRLTDAGVRHTGGFWRWQWSLPRGFISTSNDPAGHLDPKKGIGHPTEAECWEALSASVVAWGRSQAGLPPLDEKAPGG